jgi:hypothetical protein
VPEHLADDLGIGPGRKPQRSEGVAQIMESDTWQTSVLQQSLQIAREALDGPAREVIHAVIERAGRREGVWRAALGRLFVFCREESWDPLDLDASDLDDFRDWLIRLGLERNWEIGQVAGLFCGTDR